MTCTISQQRREELQMEVNNDTKYLKDLCNTEYEEAKYKMSLAPSEYLHNFYYDAVISLAADRIYLCAKSLERDSNSGYWYNSMAKSIKTALDEENAQTKTSTTKYIILRDTLDELYFTPLMGTGTFKDMLSHIKSIKSLRAPFIRFMANVNDGIVTYELGSVSVIVMFFQMILDSLKYDYFLKHDPSVEDGVVFLPNIDLINKIEIRTPEDVMYTSSSRDFYELDIYITERIKELNENNDTTNLYKELGYLLSIGNYSVLRCITSHTINGISKNLQ